MRESGASKVGRKRLPEGPVLAFDTTGSLGSVAVRFLGGSGAKAEEAVETFEPSNRHAANLLPAIRRALERAGTRSSELALLVATRGPGSFTGVRVGLATLQGLALAAGTPVVGVSSLDAAAFADAAREGLPLRRLAAVDALRGELFAAVYGWEDAFRPALGPVRISPADAGGWAGECGVERICGPGVARYREAIAAPAGIEVAPEVRPLAPAALLLGVEARQCGGSTIEPLYLRAPDIHRTGG